MKPQEVVLNIHGIRTRICSNSELFLDNIRRDFEYFNTNTSPDYHLKVEAVLSHIPPLQLPKTSLWMYTKKFRCYEHNSTKEIIYPSHGKVVFNYKKGEGWVFSNHEDKLHSMVYFMLRSLTGELMERKGYHRVHALGVSMESSGGVFLAPIRGGKTTLALELLKREKVKLLSEDTPLIDKYLILHPFPIRIGVRTDIELEIPNHLLRDFKGISPKPDPKKLIDISYFEDKIERKSVKLRWLMIMKRPQNTTSRCTISEAGKLQALKALIKNLILGKGVCQGKEFFLKKDPKDLAIKTTFISQRLRIALSIASSTPAYFLNLSTDPAENAEKVIQFIESLNSH